MSVQLHAETTLSFEPIKINGQIVGYSLVALIDRPGQEDLEMDAAFIVERCAWVTE